MKTTALFEYTCPECGRGTVRTTRIQNYKTKIKGYPFVVGEALIGVCDHCQAEEFAPEETKRWEELFYRSLEGRQAFLSPKEITELRTALGLSMEDFARLTGCTRQSISMWEKLNRTSPPSRMADLLMKLVRQSLHTGPVDVLTFLLDEARKWGIVVELRRPMRSDESRGVVLLMKKKLKSVIAQEASPYALAAEDSGKEEQIVAESIDGRHVGVLGYDYERAALILDVTSNLPFWKTVDVEIETRDGRRFTGQGLSVQGGRLLLLEQTPLRVGDVAQIMLKPHHEETRG